jgi:hypothetical protein
VSFCRARKWVDENLNFDKQAKLSLFETTIRIVGGLISAFDLSNDNMFLEKATRLVDMLMPVFDTASTGSHPCLPSVHVSLSVLVRMLRIGRIRLGTR